MSYPMQYVLNLATLPGGLVRTDHWAPTCRVGSEAAAD